MLNLGKFLNKKVIFIFIVVLILVGGGFFWWQKSRETPIEKWEAAKVSPEEDYVVKETPEGKIVENKKMGLTYKIPQDWTLEKGSPTAFFSPDIKFREGSSSIFFEKGCKINVYASYIKTNLDTLKKFIEADFSNFSTLIKVDESSVLKLSGYPALKYKYHIENFKMEYVSINFPSENKHYKISLSNPIDGEEHCEAEFNKFLETVSVD